MICLHHGLPEILKLQMLSFFDIILQFLILPLVLFVCWLGRTFATCMNQFFCKPWKPASEDHRMLSIGLIADYCFLVNSASNVVIQKPSWIWWISFKINQIPIMVNWLNLFNLLCKNHWIPSTPKHFFLFGLNR